MYVCRPIYVHNILRRIKWSVCVPVALPRIAMQKTLVGFQNLTADTNKQNDFASSGNQNPAVQPTIR